MGRIYDFVLVILKLYPFSFDYFFRAQIYGTLEAWPVYATSK